MFVVDVAMRGEAAEGVELNDGVDGRRHAPSKARENKKVKWDSRLLANKNRVWLDGNSRAKAQKTASVRCFANG
jgi:hypothetical protein